MRESLLLALSAFFLVNNNVVAVETQDAPLQLSDDEAYVFVTVACGDPVLQCGDQDLDVALIHEKHEVRCCSDTPKSGNGWVHNTPYGCEVWGGSYLVGTDNSDVECHHDATYEEAVAICKANDARVCTKDEIMNRCTKGSGCYHDHDLIWTSDIAPPPAPTVSPSPTSVPAQDVPLNLLEDDPSVYVAVVCGDPTLQCGDYDLDTAHLSERHEVRCCSDVPIYARRWAKNTQYGCSVYGGSYMMPPGGGAHTCHRDTTYSEAVDICKSNGARLCTQEEIFSRCTRGTGCMHDLDLIWTSTLAPPPAPTVSSAPSPAPLPPNTYFYLVCGDRTRFCGNEDVSVAPVLQKHEVRCCSDTAKSGWKRHGGCSVWSQSNLAEDEQPSWRKETQCYHESTYEEAEAICESNGARLCTKEEVMNQCTKHSGCGHDRDLVWTSTRASDEEVQQYLNKVRTAAAVESVCTGPTGTVWGDPHVITFDGLKYDCQGRGEFVMAMSKGSDPLQIHGRFVDGDWNMRPSVTRSIAIKVDESVPVIHVTVPDEADENNFCPFSFSVGPDETPVATDQVVSYFSQMYPGQVNVYTNGKSVIFTYPDYNARIQILSKKGRFNCVLRTNVCLTPSKHGGSANIVGLLGSPNGNINDDWMLSTSEGGNVPVPAGKWDRRKEGHNYCMDNWCVADSSASLYTSETFTKYNKCPDRSFDPDAFIEMIENVDPAVLTNCEQNTNHPEECVIDVAVATADTDEDPTVMITEIVEEEEEMEKVETLTEVEVIEHVEDWESSTTVVTSPPTPVPEEEDEEDNDDDLATSSECVSGRRLQREVRKLEEGPECSAGRNSKLDYKGDFLMQKWGITEPNFNYKNQVFALCYGVSDMMSNNMPNYEIYRSDCKTPVTPDVLAVTQDVFGDSFDPTGGLGDRTQELRLALDPEILPTSNIYSEPEDALVKVEFCVRNQLFIEGGPEVNFLETIVTLTVDLRNCFEITDIGVQPLDKTDETATENFDLEGFLCDENNLEIEDPDAKQFSQGSIIRVCVTPDERSRQENLYMRYIDDFTWRLRGNPSVVQDAIVGPNQEAPIGLSFIDCTPGSLICAFDTLLRADFYVGSGNVDGSGSAVMQFGNSATIGRRLQRDEDLAVDSEDQVASQFKMDVTLSTEPDGFRRRSGSTRSSLSTFLFYAGMTGTVVYLLL